MDIDGFLRVCAVCDQQVCATIFYYGAQDDFEQLVLGFYYSVVAHERNWN
jgi:hypothetical protein